MSLNAYEHFDSEGAALAADADLAALRPLRDYLTETRRTPPHVMADKLRQYCEEARLHCDSEAAKTVCEELECGADHIEEAHRSELAEIIEDVLHDSCIRELIEEALDAISAVNAYPSLTDHLAIRNAIVSSVPAKREAA